jgi:hypothetical protein
MRAAVPVSRLALCPCPNRRSEKFDISLFNSTTRSQLLFPWRADHYTCSHGHM